MKTFRRFQKICFYSGMLVLLMLLWLLPGAPLGVSAAAGQLAAQAGTAQPTLSDAPPAILETRVLSLEYPAFIPVGNTGVIRLTLVLDESSQLTPTLSLGGNAIAGQPISLSNVYDTHNVLAEARLDMTGLDVRPSSTISEPLLPGQKITFYWSLLPNEPGNYRGTVWFYLRFVPKGAGAGAESRQALSAQAIEIESGSLLGLPAHQARWLGFLGSMIGLVLGWPFWQAGLRWLWHGRRAHSNLGSP